jgi:hypothetical protein
MSSSSPTLPLTSTIACPTSLVPIRIDVTFDEVRIVDTLLFDPSCWPIPLTQPLEQAVEENVQELAQSLLFDAEVYGMGRTVRHFTGRTDVWTRSLQQKVAEQLRPQLWALLVASCRPFKGKKDMVKIHLRLSINGVNINDDFQWDPNVPDQCPIAFATKLAEDLKLPEDAVPAIATAICEQLCGIQVEGTPKPTSAFLIDVREQATNVAHVANLHRPSSSSTQQ